MSWAIGEYEDRDIGYGVPAQCDHEHCSEDIDRGLGYVCGGDIYGGEHGCGLFFCGHHMYMGEYAQACIRCLRGHPPFKPSPDTLEWSAWKLYHPSWAKWRAENPRATSVIATQVLRALNVVQSRAHWLVETYQYWPNSKRLMGVGWTFSTEAAQRIVQSWRARNPQLALYVDAFKEEARTGESLRRHYYGTPDWIGVDLISPDQYKK